MNEESFVNKKNPFQERKKQTLCRNDLSLKGSIDKQILNLCNIINNNPCYYTTSSCSGRITLIEKQYRLPGLKTGNKFHLNSHTPINNDEFKIVIDNFKKFPNTDNKKNSDNCLWLKFEPFIMHIQCFDINKARCLLNLAIQNGYRNSGVTFGKPDKFMVAIRSTSSMEVPIVCNGKFETEDRYIEFLCDEVNRRLGDNKERLEKLELAIIDFLKEKITSDTI